MITAEVIAAVEHVESRGQWRWRFREGHPHGGTFNRAADVWHETEEAALVAALEAAGRR